MRFGRSRQPETYQLDDHWTDQGYRVPSPQRSPAPPRSDSPLTWTRSTDSFLRKRRSLFIDRAGELQQHRETFRREPGEDRNRKERITTCHHDSGRRTRVQTPRSPPCPTERRFGLKGISGALAMLGAKYVINLLPDKERLSAEPGGLRMDEGKSDCEY